MAGFPLERRTLEVLETLDFEPSTLKPNNLKPSLRSSPVTPPRFPPLGQPETRFADEKAVTQ